jgi:NADPH:quinone reductase-like Zn-dependent oxidoreductase
LAHLPLNFGKNECQLVFKTMLKFFSAGIRKKAKRIAVNFSFLFMKAQGEQLSQIIKLIEPGVIKPFMDKVFPFEQTNEAMPYIETGRAKGDVVVRSNSLSDW